MAIGTSDGKTYEDSFAYAVSKLDLNTTQSYPEAPEGYSFYTGDAPITGVDSMGPGASTEPAGAFKSPGGTQVALNYDKFTRSDVIEDVRTPVAKWGPSFGENEGGPPVGVDVNDWSYYQRSRLYKGEPRRLMIEDLQKTGANPELLKKLETEEFREQEESATFTQDTFMPEKKVVIREGDSIPNDWTTISFEKGPLKKEELAKLPPDEANRTVWGKLTGSDRGERYRLWPEEMVRGVYDNIKAFMTTEPGSEANVQASTRVAGDLGLLGFVTAPLKPGLGLFGGRMTKQSVDAAEAMEKRGFSPQTVKEITGLERGADDMWRKEFSDSDAVLKLRKFDKIDDPHVDANTYAAKLSVVLNHPELYRIYPEAKDITIFKVDNVYGSKTALGMYHPSGGGHGPSIEIKNGLNNEETKSVLLHELQHWIQEKEGFHYGVEEQIPKAIKDQLTGWRIRKTAEDRGVSPAELIERLKLTQGEDVAEYVQRLITAAERTTYMHLAAETEARNVQARMLLDKDLIKKIPATHTEDVPREYQLVQDAYGNLKKIGNKEYKPVSDDVLKKLEEDLSGLLGRPKSENIPTPANDTTLVRSKPGNYQMALNDQLIKKIEKDAIIKDYKTWRKIADEEIGADVFSEYGPNAFTAARQYSRGGKYTIVLNPNGQRVVYYDGKKIMRDRLRDMPTK